MTPAISLGYPGVSATACLVMPVMPFEIPFSVPGWILTIDLMLRRMRSNRLSYRSIFKLVPGDALNCLLRPFYTADYRDYRRKPIVDIEDVNCRNGPLAVSSSSPRVDSAAVNFPGA